MVAILVYQTNLYSTQKYGKSVNTIVPEVEQYIGMYLKMGLVQMPNVRCYWEQGSRHSPIADTMPRNRFLKLMACLHVVDNMQVPEQEKKDKVWKLRPWIVALQRNLEHIEQEEYNAVDEMMVPFTGRSTLKQYMPNKPVPWGFKLWGRAGATGILYQFDVYQGKGDGNYTFGLGGDTVLNMCSKLPSDEGFKLAADNFFSSLELVVELSGRGIQYVGTLRQNRLKYCCLLSEKNLKPLRQGACDHRVDNGTGISVVRWFNRKAVTLVSNFVSLEPVEKIKRYDRKAKVHVDVPRPAIVAVYNSFMGGIDQHNYQVALYNYNIRFRRWYMYIFYHTLYICAVNAWNIHRRQCGQLGRKAMKLRLFIAELSENLTLCGKTRRGRRPSLPSSASKKRKLAPKQPQNDRKKVVTRKRQIRGERPGNVLVLGIDSTSQLNFDRHMKRTRKLLTEELFAFEFLGYNKDGVSLGVDFDFALFGDILSFIGFP
ncbi:LOW QUALITY PROTEIN: piggyBac transposable element-derived protein 3 [Rhipicephalus microplus]|uniref:LOW QUALITY PROTEIN: piggyBac transposable element-derived protein 3 n=1 Tax=Rhipicephalus microplus TaxID=6941 RepID=UPI003F6BC87F